MTVDDFQSLMAEATFPVQLKTTGGNRYKIQDASAFWIPGNQPNLVFVALRKGGIPCIHIDKIESIEMEAIR